MSRLSARSSRAYAGASQPGLSRPPGDFLATEPAATRALLRVESFPGLVWEPACGAGDMAEELKRATDVHASDLIDRGYGLAPVDFLVAKPPEGVKHVVTNPPYSLDEEFVQRALSLSLPGKVAMLLRLAWLERARRRETLWSARPPARVWVFSKRVKFARDGGPNFQSGLIAFAWFVWDPDWDLPPQLGWV